MGDPMKQTDRINAYARLIEAQIGKAVRPYRKDGFVNVMNRYGTSKDTTEQYRYVAEPIIPDDTLTTYYEGNGLFAKIIDAPAEEAVKHGFELDGISDEAIEGFYKEALDELDWEEVFMTGIKWARLFGGSLGVMLINDGRGLEEPLNWKNIKSIDDIRVYDRSVIQPDYTSMFKYEPEDPFRTRGSRLGIPERYYVTSRYGNFTVHESRCLVFQNGILPENCTNSNYQIWGMPEYVRIHRALRDAELAHGSAIKMLDRSVQAVYKMKDLSAELATEEGEGKVLRRLQTIDMARGMLNSITIDSEGEDYDFRTFQFSGVSDVIDASCNFLSALTMIPQTILFGRSPAGLNATGTADLENWYNFVDRIRKTKVRSNLRYLLSVLFSAGVSTGEIEEIPKIVINFNPLWSLSELEQADLEQKKAQTDYTKAQTAQIYTDMQALDPSEVRKKLASDSEFEIDNILSEEDLDEDFLAGMSEESFTTEEPEENSSNEVSELDKETAAEGSTPTNAPAATKLPQDMTAEEKAEVESNTDKADAAEPFGVGVIVIKDGKILTGTRHNDSGYGLICGPGGHGEEGETPEQSAYRETEEEFGISPKELIPIGIGPFEPESGLRAHIFICTDFDGQPDCLDMEMVNPKFRTLEELEQLDASLFPPFKDSLEILKRELCGKRDDGGPGSGNHGHAGVPGQVGGSAPSGRGMTAAMADAISSGDEDLAERTFSSNLKKMPIGSSFTYYGTVTTKVGEDEFISEHPLFGKNTGKARDLEETFLDTYDEDTVIEYTVPEGPQLAIYNGETNEYVSRDEYSARKQQFEKNAGREFTDEEVSEMVNSVTDYTGTDYCNILAAQSNFSGRFAGYSMMMSDVEKEKAIKDAENVEKALKYSDKYEGTVKRALGFDLDGSNSNVDDFEGLVAELESGEPFTMGHMSSWTTSDSIVQQVLSARTGNSDDAENFAEVVMTCKSKSGVSIDNLSCMNQSEVLFGKEVRFRAVSINRKQIDKGDYFVTKIDVELEEVV